MKSELLSDHHILAEAQKPGVRAVPAIERSLWELALEGAGQGVWDLDLSNGTAYYSPVWYQMRGFVDGEDIDALLGSWFDRLHPDEREYILERTRLQNSGELPYNAFEYRERARNGGWIWILSRGRPVAWNSDGSVARIVGTDTDITKLKLIEQQLAEEKERLHGAAGVGELTGELLSQYSGLVFDVDLRSVELVRRLKRVLPQPGSTCRIFLVDPNVRVTSVHATVLGADASLPWNGPAQELQAELHRLLGTGESKLWQSISHGTQLLDATFQALTKQATLDTENVLLAGTSIADAILDEGTEQWLDSVRRHHVGTFQHCLLVTGIAAGFGARTGMARKDVITLTIAGLLHDIGKAAVPVAILDKPSALSADEMAIIKTHPVVGAQYLDTHSAVDPAIRRTVRHHHELLDGTGYPDGLKGNEIDDLTRILTICDIYAALVERRAYKEPKSALSAINILEALGTAGKVEMDLVGALRRSVIG